jgi:hypothetical protein
MKSNLHQLEKIGAIAGIVSIIFYFSAAVLSGIPDYLGRLLGFTFPLLWIVSYMGLYRFLKEESHTPTLEIAYFFGIIGAAIGCTFIVVQQANFMFHDAAMESAKTEEAKALLQATMQGANRVQEGMDVVFDIFVTISWILFGINIARKTTSRKILGWITCLLSLGLLTLNMITFPTAPAEAGLIDLGPFLGLWILVVYIWFAVAVYKKKSGVEASEHNT